MSESLSLEDVLRKINDAVGDFRTRPAASASDVGAFGDYPMHKVAIWGDVPSAEVLLDHGADIDAPGEDGDTPLHRAIGSRKLQMVRFLVSRGADVTRQNRYGQTPLDDARDTHDNEFVTAINSCSV